MPTRANGLPFAGFGRVSIAVIIVSAGRGRRLGGEIPKQYLPIGGTCALRRSVEAFLAFAGVTRVLPVIHPDDASLCEEALGTLAAPELLEPVPGGDTRAASVRNGLEALALHEPDQVLVHDAARPFVSQATIQAVVDALRNHDGACAALRVVDAIWREGEGGTPTPVARSGLWRAQTPQGFAFSKILAAHRAHDGSGADDVAVAVEAGMTVRFVEGSEANYKITTPGDLERAIADAARMDGPADGRQEMDSGQVR